MPVTFETFDPTPYQRTPMLSAEGTLALARSLLAVVPEAAPDHVTASAEKLAAQVEIVQSALTQRRRENPSMDYTAEVAFDGAVDGLWGAFRDRLSAWLAFENPGLAVLVPARSRNAAAVELGRARKNAARARVLLDRMFGPDGVTFTRKTYPEQSEAMASILRLIEEDELAEELADLAGSELLTALMLCQSRYEDMVQARISRDQSLSADHSALRSKLRRAVLRYTNAVLTMLDEDDEPSLRRVLAALRPIDVMRARAGRSRGGGSDEGVEGEEAEAPQPPELTSLEPVG